MTVAAQGVFAGAIDAAGRFAVVGTLNHGASLWRLSDRERLFDWKHAPDGYPDLAAAGISTDGHYAVTCEPRNLILWDTSTGAALGYWGSPGAILAATAANDGRTVLLGMDDHSALLFDAVDGAYLATLQHEGRVYSVALTPDASRALTTSEDHTATLWSLPDASPLQRFDADNPIRVGALASDGRSAFTATQSGTLTLWDGNTGASQELARDHRGVTEARYVRDDTQVLVGYANGRIEVWSTRSATRVRTLQAPRRQALRATGNAIAALAYDRGKKNYVALIGDGQIVKYRAR